MKSIRTKLMLGFSAVIMVFLISVLVTLYFMRAARYDSNLLQNQLIPAQHAAINVQSEFTALQRYINYFFVLKDASAKTKITKQISDLEEAYHAGNTIYASIDNRDLKAKYFHLSKKVESYLVGIKTVMDIADKGEIDRAIETYKTDVLPLVDNVFLSMNDDLADNGSAGLLYTVNETINAAIYDMDNQIRFIFLSTMIFLLISVILSFVISNITSRSIINPILYSVKIAEDIASGKRDMEIENTYQDETGLLLKSLNHMLIAIKTSERTINEIAEDNKRLYESVVKAANLFSKHATNVASGELSGRLDLEREGISQEIMQRLGKDLNSMTDNLSNVTSDIMMACSSMVTTLEEVRHAVDAQSSGASEQASSINEITASITEIEKSASQTMNKAKDLGSVAEKTRQSGQLGLESIESSVIGMKIVRDRVQVIAQTILDLSRQTQQVGEITSVVNNLAQQSKMLALNASIEAAKAGDAGKGFAVVASEVKNLAEQSEQSTSQVQKILEDIRIATEKAVMVTEEGTKGVDNGLTMIERTGEVIRDLNDVIREASMVSQQIEAAVRQETAGIEQITAGMNEINTVTTSFVDSVSQTTEAMDNLANLSSKLKSRVETYKL